MRALIVPNGCSTVSRRWRVACGFASRALLHGFEQMLMLPSRNQPLRPCSALRFERTILAGRGPEAPYPLAILLVRKPIRQLLPSRTAIGVFLRQIDNVLFAEAAKRWSRKPSSISAPLTDRLRAEV
jgi:hypothetical protein